MVENVKGNPDRVENWSIQQIENDFAALPILVGNINGKSITTEILFWLDIENKVAMTEKNIYHLGQPNKNWFGSLISAGYNLKDLEIKGTNH